MDKGLIDIGLLLKPVDMEKYEFVRMPVKKRWVVVMRSDDPLSKKDRITAKDLAGLPIILPRRLNIQSEVASWFGPYYKELDVRFVSNLSSNAAVMVDKGMGYKICIEGFLPFWDSKKIAYRLLYPELIASSVLAWKRNQPFSKVVQKFIEHTQCL